MKTKWVIHKLKSHLPSSVTSLISSFKPQIYQPPSSNLSTFLLNHVDMSKLLSLCGKEGYFNLGSSIHASIIKNHEFFDLHDNLNLRNVLVIWNSLLTMYSNSGVFTGAAKLFDEMPLRDTISWNTMISGFLSNGELVKGFVLFKRMRESGFFQFDQATLTTLLSAFDRPELIYATKMMHCLLFLNGFEHEITVGNALITSYCKCGCPSFGRQVFDEMLGRNVISWTAIMSGLSENELYRESLRLFSEMRCGGVIEPNLLTYLSSLMACSGLQGLGEGCQIHGVVSKLGIQSDLRVESALMDMYSKCGRIEDAWRIFESADELDEVSMTVILVGFAQNGFEEEAVRFFVKMVKAGAVVDPNMVSAVLGVFGVDTSLGLGKQIHSLVIKRSFGSNLFVGNGLINMYSKCGELQESMKIFNRIQKRNSVSWNSVIAAFARHGDGFRALQLYNEMQREGVEPTDVTFLSLLHACSHVGLVDMGMEFFTSMTEDYTFIPRTEHYACVVDMLGRAGLTNEAKAFIEKLPIKPDVFIWQSLLGACSIHGDTEIGKYAAEKLFLSEPKKPAPYVLLANIYSGNGRWNERARTIKRMKEMGVAKDIGISWIEIEKKMHSFVVEDKLHPEGEIIYKVLGELFRVMIDEGYVPDKRYILYCLDHDDK
ncbi:pentatricopeptide repeat-containing protein At3g05340 [Euphorbia lathyris]|uniref:pentatricopeptide repeat-containing protein At3g05340 n=1 Tax=Euphorbia lathyris TaxID=212925 RepID=UPI00331441AD